MRSYLGQFLSAWVAHLTGHALYGGVPMLADGWRGCGPDKILPDPRSNWQSRPYLVHR